MKKIGIVLFVLIITVFLSGCGSNANNNSNNDSGDTNMSGLGETVDVLVSEKEGASHFIPQFDSIKSRGGFTTVSVSDRSNKFAFDWSHSTNIYKVWSLDTSQKKATMLFSSEVKKGKLENLPVVVSWSPDESKIMMVLRDGKSNYNLYTINSDGSGLVQLTVFDKDSKGRVSVDPEPIWDKSGEKIIFTDSFYKNQEKNEMYSKLKSVNVEDKLITEIGGMDGKIENFSWLNDREIIFSLSPNHADGEVFYPDRNLFNLDTQSKTIKSFTTDGRVMSASSVSPDGKKVAYFKSGDNPPFPPVLVISDMVGNILKKMESLQDILGSTRLVWSPDSEKIAFLSPEKITSSSASTSKKLFIVDISTSEVKKNLIDSLKPQFILKWGDDGKIYLASNSRDSLFIVYNPN